MRWVLPSGQQGKAQLTLSELAQYRGLKIEEVLRRAFERHHERSNYNNEKDIVGALERMGIAGEPFKAHYPNLNAMMSWRTTTESFGEQLLSSL